MPSFRLALAGALLLATGCAGAAQVPPAATALPAAESARGESLAPTVEPIAAQEYAARRARLAGHMEDGVLLVLGAGEPEADYLPFAQTPAFRYLTGITEPGGALLVSKRGGRVEERLFVLPRNPARELWEGARLGPAGAQSLTGVESRTIDRLLSTADSLLQGGGVLYTTGAIRRGTDAGDPLQALSPEQQLLARLTARHPSVRLASLERELERLRAAKSAAELDRIRRAVHITNLAHRAVMRAAEPGMNEFELQALIEYTFRRNGAERPAFASIVGSGPNSTTLHYNADDRFIQDGEVVVMDVGASYDGYAADVTRTIPISGRFTEEQRAIYELVLAAQKAAEARVRVGGTWTELQSAATATLAQGLARLGLIEAPGATYQCGAGRCPQLQLFFPHGLGHGIGLEVHDPDASCWSSRVACLGSFQPGSAFTIEPGIYVRADALDFLPDTPENRSLVQRLRPAVERYRNIGARIEDDYLLTASGLERLTAGAPREVEEVEEIMRQQYPDAGERRRDVVEWYRSIQPR